MTDADAPPKATLTLPIEKRWTLHHVLLDRIEQESIAEQAANVESPPIEVYQAFDVLDSGGTTLTIDQLEAIQTVLAEYHHSTEEWQPERFKLEHLLQHIGELIDQTPTPEQEA